jgi:predicted nucleic acid-binding protein
LRVRHRFVRPGNGLRDIEDAIQVAHMAREGLSELYSYDTDFDRLPTIARQEP